PRRPGVAAFPYTTLFRSGVMRGALGHDFAEWRPAQVADFVRLQGSGRYALGQSEEHALADMRRELDALESRFPGLKAKLTPESTDRKSTRLNSSHDQISY